MHFLKDRTGPLREKDARQLDARHRWRQAGTPQQMGGDVGEGGLVRDLDRFEARAEWRIASCVKVKLNHQYGMTRMVLSV